MSNSSHDRDSEASSPIIVEETTPGVSFEKHSTLRPLSPRPLALNAASSHPARPSERITRRQRSNVTLACNECKSKKSRCDGRQPCSRCTEKRLNCYFDHGKDRRRIRGSTTETLVLSDRVDQYQRLLNALRTAPTAHAIQILNRLRSPPPDALQQTLEDDPDPDFSEVLQFAEDLYENMSLEDSQQVPSGATMWLSSPDHLQQNGHGSGPPASNLTVIDPHWPNVPIPLDASNNANPSLSTNVFSLPQEPSINLDFLETNRLNQMMDPAYRPQAPTDNTTAATWRSRLDTDWEQATGWLNQDMDDSARLLAGQSRNYSYSQERNSGPARTGPWQTFFTGNPGFPSNRRMPNDATAESDAEKDAGR